jgi:exopolysaccharide biosynthesis polyprenyl glycosylphosphotransferase
MILLMILDVFSVYFAFHFATLSRFGTQHIPTFWFSFMFLSIIAFFVFLYQKLYDRKMYVNQTELFLKVVLSSLYVSLFYILLTFFAKFDLLELSRITIILFSLYFLGFNVFFRIVLAPYILEKWFSSYRRKNRVVVYGNQGQKEKILKFLYKYPILGFRFCDSEKEECTNTAFLWCSKTDLGTIYKEIKGKLSDYSLVQAIIPNFQNFRMEPTWTKVDTKPVWQFYSGNHHKLTEFVIRICDIIFSIFALTLLSPVMFFVALVIRIKSGSPVFFRQKRVGKDGELFTFLKFRSMENNTKSEKHEEYVKKLITGNHKEGEIFKMEDDPRITKFGRFLRKTSIDELPQFFNVLKGDMSIVGPRPPIPYEVEMYEDWHKERLTLKPGITGYWQVFGRSSLPFDESVFLDLYYKENRSVLMNLYLCLKTIPRVLNSVGAE